MKAMTFGGVMINTIAIIASDRIERMSMLYTDSSFRLLEEGRKTDAHEISTHCGDGAINAASVVRHVDTQTGLLRREAIDPLLAHGGARPAVRKWLM